MWLALIPVLGELLKKILPDTAQRQEAEAKLKELAAIGELEYLKADVQLAVGQMEVNKVEAASESVFKSGWRPATGWLCVLGFAYMTVVRPILPWALTLTGTEVPPLPAIDTGEIAAILLGMLGLGGLRSFEKAKKLR